MVDSGKGRGSATVGAGIGLANVRERLRLIYGDEHSGLTAGRDPEGQFRVEINLPLEFP